jgi:hypothetical protein
VYWQWLYQEINQLKAQLSYLAKNIPQSEVTYEYVIGKIKIDKVKGEFQIGKLIKGNVIDKSGRHRFHINEIEIKEIEGTGTVGVGITKKRKTENKKKKYDKVPPDQATGKIKEIYNEIEEAWEIEYIPLFFQRLATHPSLLEKLWELTQVKIVNSSSFQPFHDELREHLYKQIKEAVKPMWQFQKPNIYNKLQKQIEGEIKTLFIIYCFIIGSLPSYLDNLASNTKEKIGKNQLEEDTPKKKNQPEEILKKLKEAYQLKELPKVIVDLKESPEFLIETFKVRVKEFIVSSKDAEILAGFYQKLDSIKENININVSLFDMELNANEEEFLISLLLWGIRTIPKFLLLMFIYLWLSATLENNKDI